MNYRQFGSMCVKHSRCLLILFAGIVIFLGGCSYKSSRDDGSVEGENAAVEGGGYRDMLNRARNRKAYQHSLQQVKDAVQAFQVDLGRLPTNLLEVMRFRYLESFPKQVPPGYTWGYDAVYGRVSFIKIPEDQQPSGQTGAEP